MRQIDAEKLDRILREQVQTWREGAKRHPKLAGYATGMEIAAGVAVGLSLDDPVRHGQYVEATVDGMRLYPDGQKMCSICNTIMPHRWTVMPPYCFGCGARMDGDDHAGNL